MKKGLYMALLLGVSVMLGACSLDEENPMAGNATLQNFDVWAGMQTTCYEPINKTLYKEYDFLFMSECGTDLWVRSGNAENWCQMLQYEELTTSYNTIKKVFPQAYTSISTCNTIIATANEVVGGDEAAIKTLVAETKALRAFYYSILVTHFGPVTLNLEPAATLTGTYDQTPVRSSEKDIYNQIFKDYTEAIADLPIAPYNGNRGRFTKKAAMGLLARAYAQRAGLTKYGDSEEYWQLAYDTATDLITNAATYGAHLYTDIADMWADANNRTNKEALLVSAGADVYNETEAFANITQCNLLSYTCGSCYTDMYTNSKHRPDKGNSYFYGRLNQAVWAPSQYLLNCFKPKWDRRWEYSFIYAWHDWTMVHGIAAMGKNYNYESGILTLTEGLCDIYGIDKSHVGKKIYPYGECDCRTSLPTSQQWAYQYVGMVWPEGDMYNKVAAEMEQELNDLRTQRAAVLKAEGKTDEEITKTVEDEVRAKIEATLATKALQVAPSADKCGTPGYSQTTKAFAVPYPVAADDDRFNAVFVHAEDYPADKSDRRYALISIDHLFGSNGLPYGTTVAGSEAANSPHIGNGSAKVSGGPAFHKFNWAFDGCFTTNQQKRTGDIYVMRMAEVYLIAAEAAQMLGKTDAAQYINALRQRAVRNGASESDWKMTGSVTEDDILDEYARELCGEYNRWSLLKRHNIIKERLDRYNVRAAKSFKSHMYNRPIASSFLESILNAEEYGDNGYGSTASSGLDAFM